MAYQRQNLKDGDCLCAHNIEKMEDALCDMPCVEKARVGQVLAVAEVDLTGKPKRYAAVDKDIPESVGAEEIYIGETAPTDKNIKIFIDTDEPTPTLNFTGAVNESWDGTEDKTINIPEGGGVGTDEEIVAVLIETDMLPAVYDGNGILCDENRNVILRY